jgi:preprotein translocase subunit YajC
MIDFFSPAAHAAGGAAPGGAGFFGPDLFIILAFALVFYFIIWRPQSKRAKEHKDLVGNIAKGDEIITNGGLIGKVVKIDDQFLVLLNLRCKNMPLLPHCPRAPSKTSRRLA